MFAIEIPYCDFNLIHFNKNQALRWIRVSEDKYIIINGKDIVLAYQRKDKKYFFCNEETFYDKWYNYFDINYDYYESLFELRRFIKNCKNKYIALRSKYNKGIRLINQDLFESMISYSLDDDIFRNQKIKYISTFGNKKHNTLQGLSINWNEFPTPKQLYYANLNCNLTTNEKERIKIICENAKLIKDIDPENEEEVYKTLQLIYNDNDWIKRVMIYCFGYKDYFPINKDDQLLFKRIKIKPKDFNGFKNKGLILNYITGGNYGHY